MPNALSRGMIKILKIPGILHQFGKIDQAKKENFRVFYVLSIDIKLKILYNRSNCEMPSPKGRKNKNKRIGVLS
jgi:hypothetical protein